MGGSKKKEKLKNIKTAAIKKKKKNPSQMQQIPHFHLLNMSFDYIFLF